MGQVLLWDRQLKLEIMCLFFKMWLLEVGFPYLTIDFKNLHSPIMPHVSSQHKPLPFFPNQRSRRTQHRIVQKDSIGVPVSPKHLLSLDIRFKHSISGQGFHPHLLSRSKHFAHMSCHSLWSSAGMSLVSFSQTISLSVAVCNPFSPFHSSQTCQPSRNVSYRDRQGAWRQASKGQWQCAYWGSCHNLGQYHNREGGHGGCGLSGAQDCASQDNGSWIPCKCYWKIARSPHFLPTNSPKLTLSFFASHRYTSSIDLLWNWFWIAGDTPDFDYKQEIGVTIFSRYTWIFPMFLDFTPKLSLATCFA